MFDSAETLKPAHHNLNIPFTFLLTFTLFVQFNFIRLITWLTLVPWDTTPTRPPLDTWQRTHNDFFENPQGSTSLATLITSISIYIFIKQFRKAQKPIFPQLTFWFTISIFISITIWVIGFALAGITRDIIVAQFFTERIVGYGISTPFIINMLCAIVILFFLQSNHSLQNKFLNDKKQS